MTDVAAPEAKSTALEKRTHVYVRPPRAYEIPGCSCGNADPQWSEFAGHLWCEPCQKDFIPEHNGIFEGPIPVNAAMMLGISFDRIEIATGNYERFDPQGCGYLTEPPERWQCYQCEKLHDTSPEALKCCDSSVAVVWTCLCCDKPHHFRERARQCCRPPQSAPQGPEGASDHG